MIKKITEITTIAIIGILLVTGILVPMLQNFGETTIVKYNNIEQVLSKAEDGISEVEVTFDSENPTNTADIFVNGEKVKVVSNKILFASENVFISGYTALEMTVNNLDGTATEYNPLTACSYVVNGPENTITVTYAVNGGEVSTRTIDYGSWGFTVNPNGDHTNIVIWTPRTIYLNDISQMYLINSRVGSTYVSGIGDKITIGDDVVTATYTKNDIDNVRGVFYMDLTPSPETSDYTYLSDGEPVEARYIIVPITVIGEKVPENDYSILLNTLPIFVLMGLCIGLVGYYRRT